MIAHTWADQLLSQLLMETFDTLTSQYKHIRHLHKEVKCQKYYIILSRFDGLCFLSSFTLLTITVRGYQINTAYCLFSFWFSNNANELIGYNFLCH